MHPECNNINTTTELSKRMDREFDEGNLKVPEVEVLMVSRSLHAAALPHALVTPIMPSL
jgi:hypothetical protein